MNIRLRWNDNPLGESVKKYRIYQSDVPGQYGEQFLVDEITSQFPPPQYVVNNIGTGKWYFVVSAVNASGEGPYSNEVSISGGVAGSKPSAPTGLTIEVA